MSQIAQEVLDRAKRGEFVMGESDFVSRILSETVRDETILQEIESIAAALEQFLYQLVTQLEDSHITMIREIVANLRKFDSKTPMNSLRLGVLAEVNKINLFLEMETSNLFSDDIQTL